MRVKLKVWLEADDGSPVMGEGTARLLQLVDEHGSLNRAAQEMRMSYRAAWGLLQELEQRLGYPLLERQAGGSHGGGSRLTPKGRELLEAFGRLGRRARVAVAELFQEEFGP